MLRNMNKKYMCSMVYSCLQLKPMFGDEEYLEEQHILIAVRSRDSDNESYGE